MAFSEYAVQHFRDPETVPMFKATVCTFRSYRPNLAPESEPQDIIEEQNPQSTPQTYIIPPLITSKEHC